MPTIEPGLAERTAVASTGLILRPVRWPEEARTLVDIFNAGYLAAGNLDVRTVDGILLSYANLIHCDLATDLRLAEADGRPVAYARVEWQDEHRGDRVFSEGCFLSPAAPDGTLDSLLDWAEARQRAIAAGLEPAGRPMLQAYVNMETPATAGVLERRGYRAVRFSFGMVRPTLEGIPDLPLPDGVEVRPVREADMRAVFDAEVANFEAHWGAGPDHGSEAAWVQFRDDPDNDTSLWQIAWAGNTIVGIVRPYINDEEFRVLGVRRGWCEHISTHGDWRGRGIAKALIARALRALAGRGMTEAALGVDADNETGALDLYRSMGFVVRTRETDFRKPLDAAGRAARR